MEKVLENAYQTSATSLDTVSRKSANLISASSGSAVSAGIAGGGPSGSGGGVLTTVPSSNTVLATGVSNVTTSNSSITTNLLPTSANGQSAATPHQQIIQVSSQAGGSIVPGQQLMLQTFQSRQAIQIRQGGQQIQQIQFIPLGNISGQTQRQPVIIQQQAPSVLHSAAGGQTTITSMANLNPSNVTKIQGVQSSVGGKPSPVIIQQSGTLLHGQATAHGLHHHNVAKITTVSRAPAGTVRTQPGKMINISTTGLAHHITGPATANSHTSVTTTTLPVTGQTPGGQVTRLGIISQIPNAPHGATVSTVHGAKPILNLATATLTAAKSVILNPAGSVVQPTIVSSSGTMHNVVGTFNGPTSQFKPQQTSGQTTNLIPTVMTLATLTTTGNQTGSRHTLITSQPPVSSMPNVSASQTFRGVASAINQNVASTCGSIASGSMSISSTAANNLSSSGPSLSITCSSLSLATNPTALLTTTASNHIQHTPTHIPPPVSGTAGNQLSSLRPTILGSNNSPLSSPIKQPMGQQTPSSPRPSILIRKRVAALTDDTKSGAAINLSGPSASSGVALNLATSGANTSSSKQINSLALSNKSMPAPSNNAVNTSVRACDLSVGASKSANNGSAKRTDDNAGAINLSAGCSSLSGNSFAARSNHVQDTNSQNNHTNENSVPSNLLTNSTGPNDSSASLAITPRKRRKQLLEPFTLTTSQNIKLLNSGDEVKNTLTDANCNLNEDDLLKKKNVNVNSGSGTSDTLPGQTSQSNICRRPRPSLLTNYNVTWRSLQNHFARHCELKVKPEKKSLNVNEQNVDSLNKRNTWKINHLSIQLHDLIMNENQNGLTMEEYLKIFISKKCKLPAKVHKEGSKPFNKSIVHNSITILDKLNELFKANAQRSYLLQDQVKEVKHILLKLTNDHRERVTKLSKRYINKRTSSSNRDKKT